MKLAYEGRLAVFTSFYSHYAYAPYVISLAQTLGVLSALGVKWDYLARPSDFHIERAINNTLTEVMEHGGFTDILLIDSDESWEPEAVVRMLLHPQEIVAGSYRMKNGWDRYVGHVKKNEKGQVLGKSLPDGTHIVQAERVAAGFLRIKILALKRWAAAYPDLVSQEPDGKKIQFFSRGLIDGEMACQDMMFSKRWIDIGGELWIDPFIKIGHWGMECHQGDFHQHLLAQKTLHEAKGSFAVVQQMAEEIKNRSAA